jgi:hypothetical protein
MATWVGAGAGLLLEWWRRSLRVTVRGGDHLDRNPLGVLACWHGRMQGPIFCVTDRGVLTMASRSLDGEVAAQAVSRLGLVAARGSTGRGGEEALEQLRTWLLDGRGSYVGLTVDGPRGPRGRVHRGAVDLARRLDLPLIPCSFSARPHWSLTSWDRMMLAPPFARALVEFGEPLRVGPDEDLAAAGARLRERLDALTTGLDLELHGRSLWSPAE